MPKLPSFLHFWSPGWAPSRLACHVPAGVTGKWHLTSSVSDACDPGNTRARTTCWKLRLCAVHLDTLAPWYSCTLIHLHLEVATRTLWQGSGRVTECTWEAGGPCHTCHKRKTPWEVALLVCNSKSCISSTSRSLWELTNSVQHLAHVKVVQMIWSSS